MIFAGNSIAQYSLELAHANAPRLLLIPVLERRLRRCVNHEYELPEALARRGLVARFAREARALARLTTERVARVIDVGTLEDGAPFIVMEYLDGEDQARVPHRVSTRLPEDLRGQAPQVARFPCREVLVVCTSTMAYNQFSLDDVKSKLGLSVHEVEGLFAGIPAAAPSAWLEETLREGASLALAVSTEKARSEWIIAPILLEVHRQRRGRSMSFVSHFVARTGARPHHACRPPTGSSPCVWR